MTSHMKYSDQVRDEAGYWVVQMSSDDVTDQDVQTFETWLCAAPEHAALYHDIKEVWTDYAKMPELAAEFPLADMVADPPSVPDDIPLLTPVRRYPAYRLYAALAAALLVVLGGAFLFLFPGLDAEFYQRHETTTAQVEEFALPDGSLITVGAKSALEVQFSRDQRQVSLQAGEAFFTVAKDPSRPFYVDAGTGMIRVVGTKFNVRRGAKTVRVTVEEGIVQVRESATTLDLTAGQQARLQKNSLVKEPVTAEPGAWRQGRLVYEDTRLSDIVEDANRYYPGQITIASASLADLRVTAIFRVDEIDRMVQTLSRILPLQIKRHSAGNIMLMAPATAEKK